MTLSIIVALIVFGAVWYNDKKQAEADRKHQGKP